MLVTQVIIMIYGKLMIMVLIRFITFTSCTQNVQSLESIYEIL